MNWYLESFILLMIIIVAQCTNVQLPEVNCPNVWYIVEFTPCALTLHGKIICSWNQLVADVVVKQCSQRFININRTFAVIVAKAYPKKVLHKTWVKNCLLSNFTYLSSVLLFDNKCNNNLLFAKWISYVQCTSRVHFLIELFIWKLLIRLKLCIGKTWSLRLDQYNIFRQCLNSLFVHFFAHNFYLQQSLITGLTLIRHKQLSLCNFF